MRVIPKLKCSISQISIIHSSTVVSVTNLILPIIFLFRATFHDSFFLLRFSSSRFFTYFYFLPKSQHFLDITQKAHPKYGEFSINHTKLQHHHTGTVSLSFFQKKKSPELYLTEEKCYFSFLAIATQCIGEWRIRSSRYYQCYCIVSSRRLCFVFTSFLCSFYFWFLFFEKSRTFCIVVAKTNAAGALFLHLSQMIYYSPECSKMEAFLLNVYIFCSFSLAVPFFVGADGSPKHFVHIQAH